MERMFEGKNVIVTGSNRGIGKKLAESFAAQGANLWLCARTQDDEFESFIQKLMTDYDITVEPVYIDLSDEGSIKSGVKHIISEKKKIDVLVNNAGVAYSGTLFMTPVDKLKEVFEVNYYAPIQMMQLVGRQMLRNKDGSIINICSVGGIEHQPGYLAYGSSKAALIWATKSVSKELAAYNIRVNAVAPGLTETSMGFYKSEEELNKTIERTSMKRMGTTEEIANAVLFLASDEASFITGTVLNVDGGRV